MPSVIRSYLSCPLGRVLLGLCVLTAARAAGQPVTRVEKLDGPGARAAHELLLARAASGYSGAVVLEKDGRLVLEAGYGLANREKAIPFTSSTIAQIGSITKQFTAVAVVDLRRRGLLRFEDSIGKYLPHTTTETTGITVHQLLTHTSGLAEYCGRDFDRATRDEFLRRCLGRKLARPPGTAVGYSNVGYSVLAAVVEHVSGTSLEDYLDERFFRPLGMTRTGYLFRRTSRNLFALGYVRDEPRGMILDSLSALAGSFWNLKGNGGMQAAAGDMYRWHRALRDGPVITDDMRKVIFAPHERRTDSSFVGYGVGVRKLANGTVQYSHSGSDGVFYSAVLWAPGERLYVYAVSNCGEDESTTTVVRDVVRAFRSASQ